ncbi:MAG TPA: sialidase family protein [Pyrinomonadaceae bacterium]|nr:sialidase family protein [Pyrinomonadaceae bacterium]
MTTNTSSPAGRPNQPPAGGPALTIRENDSPAGTDSREPELHTTADGRRVLLSWVEKVGGKRYALRFAARDAGGWSEVRTVAEGENWFINWADFPSVIELSDGSLAAHWLVKSGPGAYAYDVNISRSSDGGKTWGKPIVPHTDGTKTEHGFVSLMPLPDGRLGVSWVDGRALHGMKEAEGEHEGPLPVSMALRYAAIDAAGKLSDEAVLDERICECCQTSAALTSEGPIIVYRDRSETEVRDNYFVRREGEKWSAPRAVGTDSWEINGCPVNGPSVSAGDRRVAAAWFTGQGDDPRVHVAFSADAGATFGTPARVDDGDVMGRVDVVLLADGSALVCWMSGNEEGGANKVRRVTPDGSLGPVAVIARSDVSRASGFPRMARAGDTVHFAWTQFGKPSRVRTASTDVSAFR